MHKQDVGEWMKKVGKGNSWVQEIKKRRKNLRFGSPKPPNVEPDFGRFEDIGGL